MYLFIRTTFKRQQTLTFNLIRKASEKKYWSQFNGFGFISCRNETNQTRNKKPSEKFRFSSDHPGLYVWKLHTPLPRILQRCSFSFFFIIIIHLQRLLPFDTLVALFLHALTRIYHSNIQKKNVMDARKVENHTRIFAF